jgi:hypothetical protein
LLVGHEVKNILGQQAISAIHLLLLENTTIGLVGILQGCIHVQSGLEDLLVPSTLALTIGNSIILDVIADHLFSLPLSFEHSKIFDEEGFLFNIAHGFDGLIIFGLSIHLLEALCLLMELVGANRDHVDLTLMLGGDHT